MENFVVSARKYRPATFDTVVGQEHITTTLKNALKNNHLAQAFLFCGPRGVGKTTCARILAKTINCLQPTDDYEACGTCDNCVSFQRNGSLNIYELDAASNNSVDDIRNLVDQVRFPPQSGNRKVYIIDEVHMLSQSAFNAFLKTLEEPPSYVIFILATTEKHKIIPTILSRCQIFDFKRIEVKNIADHLKNIASKEQIKAEYEALELIAQKADGGLRDALSLFDMLSTYGGKEGINYQVALDNLHILDYDYYFRITDALLNENLGDALLIFDDILRKGFDGHNFIVGLAEHFRDLMVCKDASTIKLMEVAEKAKVKYKEQSAKTDFSFLLSALNISNQCDLNYKSSKNPRLHVELALMKMAHIPAALSLADLPPASNGEDGQKKKVVESQNPSNNSEVKNKTSSKENDKSDKDNQPDNNYSSPKIPKLDDLENELDAEEKKKDNNTKNLNWEELNEAFEHFKKVNKDDIKVAQLLNKVPDIQENHIIKFRFSEEEKSAFKKFEEKLLNSLRKRLNNPLIQIIFEIVKTEEVKPYTPQQKFEYLSNKNPIINELKDRLGLEVDF